MKDESIERKGMKDWHGEFLAYLLAVIILLGSIIFLIAQLEKSDKAFLDYLKRQQKLEDLKNNQ